MLGRYAGEHPWLVVALRLLTLTGTRLSEMINLRWSEIAALSKDGASARIKDTKTKPRAIWFGPVAARLIASLTRAKGAPYRVFPVDLTSDCLYAFRCGICEEAGLPGHRIHDCRHTRASQGVMNGVDLLTVGRLHGHERLATTAIYAHLDGNALQVAARRSAGIIAKAMGYTPAPTMSTSDS